MNEPDPGDRAANGTRLSAGRLAEVRFLQGEGEEATDPPTEADEA
jgi:hypothetical protein